MVYLVLYYLCLKIAEYAAAAFEFLVKILHCDYIMARNGTDSVKRETPLLGIVSLLGFIDYHRIKKIPMDQALKNVE